MAGRFDLDSESELLRGKWDPITEMFFPRPVFFANEVLQNLSSHFSFQLRASSQSHLKAYELVAESHA